MTAPAWLAKAPYLPVDAPLTSQPGQRLAAITAAVAAQFSVEKAARYSASAGKTWCKTYVWDFTRAMGCEVPHWMDPGTGAPVDVGAGVETTANQLVAWFTTYGQSRDWREATRAEAEAAAATGQPVVAGWPNPKGHGHVAVMLPDGTIAQAGLANFFGHPLSSGFGELPVRFFVHP